MAWRLTLTCCGRDAGAEFFETWDEADAFRESFTSGVAVHPNGYSAPDHADGHRRSGVISEEHCIDTPCQSFTCLFTLRERRPKLNRERPQASHGSR